MNHFLDISNLYITSACVTGPVIDGICIGPCVNEEYDNGSLKVCTGDDFDDDEDFEIDDFETYVLDEDNINNNLDIISSQNKQKYGWKIMDYDDSITHDNQDKQDQIEEIRREVAAYKEISNKKSIVDKLFSFH